MPEVLFMELMTTDENERIMCFDKFPSIENPVDLIPNVGGLMRFEVENNAPATPIQDRKLPVKFTFNEKLKNEIWQFTEDQSKAIDEWNETIDDRLIEFKQQSAIVPQFFPQLINFPPGGPNSLIKSAMNEVATNRDKILEIYERARPNRFPKSDVVNEKWAVYRRLQTHILVGLDYIGKYGAANVNVISKKLKNYRLDVDYIVTGVLTEALATKENSMAQFFQELLPTGSLFTS